MEQKLNRRDMKIPLADQTWDGYTPRITWVWLRSPPNIF